MVKCSEVNVLPSNPFHTVQEAFLASLAWARLVEVMGLTASKHEAGGGETARTPSSQKSATIRQKRGFATPPLPPGMKTGFESM